MTPESSATPSAHEITFAIDYGPVAAFGGLRNLDFKGSGTLTINTAVSRFRFAGPSHRLLSVGATVRSFAADEIWNVTIEGRAISFTTSKGESGARGALFVFQARNAEEATAIGAHLPRAVAGDFADVEDFAAKFRLLPAPRVWWASVTNLLIALNVAGFLALALFCNAGWFTTTDLTPYIRYGANNAAATTDGEWWRLLTSMFMHYGAFHLFMNMWALLQTGHMVERLFGRRLFTLGYLGSGLAGGLASICWHGDKTWSAGASGAVFGVYGLLLGYLLREKLALPKRVYQPMLNSTLAFAGYNLVFGLALPQIDNAAHLGGFLGGIALGWLVALPLDLTARARLAGRRLQLGLAACAVIIATGVALAPRFDYRVSEEIAWSDLADEFASVEKPLLVQEEKLHRRYRAHPVRDEEFAAFLEGNLIPFYATWEHRFSELPLTAGTSTERRSTALQSILRKRTDSYRALRDGVRNNDADALANYEQLNHEIAREIKRLSAP